MSRESFLAAVRDFHRSWELEAVDSVTVDTSYPKMTANGRYSQYSETIVDMSASTEYEDKYWDRVSELMGEHLGGSSLVVKHQQGSHDQQSHGAWAQGTTAREMPAANNKEAWDSVLTDEARSIDDPRMAHPERYNPVGQKNSGLKDGEIETVQVRGEGPPRIRDYETHTSAGLTRMEAFRAEGFGGARSDNPMRPLVTAGPERPPQHVYRVMSTDEFDVSLERGYIKSDERMNLGPEGTVTSLRSTGSFYAPTDGSDYRVVRIRYADEDGWRTDSDSYIKTQDRVPFDRVDLFTTPISQQEVVKHQQGSHDQQSHGSWATGRAGAIANSSVTGEPSGITLADMVEILDDPAAFGFEPDGLPLRYEGDEAKFVGDLQRAVVDGHVIREARQDEQFRRAAELTDGQKDDLVDYFETIRNEGTVFVAAHPLHAAQIIELGEFDTVFETNTSNGTVNYEARRREEFASHDLHPNVDPDLRPVYGYVAFDNPVVKSVDQYGSVRFELKPEVKERTTMTDGDSLGSKATPIPMSGDPITQREAVGGSLGWQSMSGQMLDEVNAVGAYFPAILDESSPQLSFPRGETAIANIIDRTGPPSPRYIEAQVKGGVKMDDVARIHVDGAFVMGDVVVAAQERGIEIVYHEG